MNKKNEIANYICTHANQYIDVYLLKSIIDELSEMYLLLEQSKVKPVSNGHSQKMFGFPDQLSLNAGQKFCRTLQWEHSAILSTFIKLPFVI